jgi:hypothetical protein
MSNRTWIFPDPEGGLMDFIPGMQDKIPRPWIRDVKKQEHDECRGVINPLSMFWGVRLPSDPNVNFFSCTLHIYRLYKVPIHRRLAFQASQFSGEVL